MQNPDKEDFTDMPVLNFPEYDFTGRIRAGKQEIFDVIRNKYVILTPEEWVRQHTVHYLNKEKKIPLGLMVLEKNMVLFRLSKRADILVYGPDKLPRMLVECKAPSVKINQDVFEQIARYNLIFKVRFLLVTNGLKHYCFRIDFQEERIHTLEEIPEWEKLLKQVRE